MTLEEYQEKKRTPVPSHREHCRVCDRPRSVCLCPLIHPFDTNIRFVILMHPKEARKEKSGTGRLCHLALKNSQLIVGVDFTDDRDVNALIARPDYTSVLLFPALGAVDVSQDGYRALARSGEKLQIFIVDGTWSLAGKILRLSENLRALPAIRFTPPQPSKFQFKKQPRAECLSTLESIHLLLDLAQEQGVEETNGAIEQLPEIFDRLVKIQIDSQTSSSKISTPN